MQNPEKVAARGQQAADLMDHALMVEAKAHIEAELWRQFQRVAPSDTESLVFVKGMQYLHEKYFAFLTNAVNDGKLAKLEIERKKKTIKERVFG